MLDKSIHLVYVRSMEYDQVPARTLANWLEVSLSHYYSICNGNRGLGSKMVKRLVAKSGVPADVWLYPGDNDIRTLIESAYRKQCQSSKR